MKCVIKIVFILSYILILIYSFFSLISSPNSLHSLLFLFSHSLIFLFSTLPYLSICYKKVLERIGRPVLIKDFKLSQTTPSWASIFSYFSCFICQHTFISKTNGFLLNLTHLKVSFGCSINYFTIITATPNSSFTYFVYLLKIYQEGMEKIL